MLPALRVRVNKKDREGTEDFGGGVAMTLVVVEERGLEIFCVYWPKRPRGGPLPPPPLEAGGGVAAVEQTVACGVTVTVPDDDPEARVRTDVLFAHTLLVVKVFISTDSC